MLKTIWTWIVRSSADPKKISLTIKAGFLAAAGYAVFAAGLFGLPGLTEASVSGVGESVAQFVEQAYVVGTGFVTLYGLVRKIALTVKKWRTG